jgi:DNA-binding transcriptional ArsR family regulator
MFRARQIDALIIGNDALFNSRRGQLVNLAARYGIPAIYPLREFAEAGGLMSYGPSLVDAVLREARLVTERREGTRRVYFIDPHGLAELRAWLDRFWDQSLAAFQAEVEREGASKERKRK